MGGKFSAEVVEISKLPARRLISYDEFDMAMYHAIRTANIDRIIVLLKDWRNNPRIKNANYKVRYNLPKPYPVLSAMLFIGYENYETCAKHFEKDARRILNLGLERATLNCPVMNPFIFSLNFEYLELNWFKFLHKCGANINAVMLDDYGAYTALDKLVAVSLKQMEDKYTSEEKRAEVERVKQIKKWVIANGGIDRHCELQKTNADAAIVVVPPKPSSPKLSS